MHLLLFFSWYFSDNDPGFPQMDKYSLLCMCVSSLNFCYCCCWWWWLDWYGWCWRIKSMSVPRVVTFPTDCLMVVMMMVIVRHSHLIYWPVTSRHTHTHFSNTDLCLCLFVIIITITAIIGSLLLLVFVYLYVCMCVCWLSPSFTHSYLCMCRIRVRHVSLFMGLLVNCVCDLSH